MRQITSRPVRVTTAIKNITNITYVILQTSLSSQSLALLLTIKHWTTRR